eukprot:365222-Chlamydomonas_euryale.AAC.6
MPPSLSGVDREQVWGLLVGGAKELMPPSLSVRCAGATPLQAALLHVMHGYMCGWGFRAEP